MPATADLIFDCVTDHGGHVKLLSGLMEMNMEEMKSHTGLDGSSSSISTKRGKRAKHSHLLVLCWTATLVVDHLF